jgi:hypothetical protein
MTVQRQFERRKAFLFGFSSLAALALAVPATAQTQPSSTATVQTPEPTTGPEPAGPDVVVTGTRIVRDGFQSPTPLTVLTLEDIQNSSPSNNIADFVNQLPSMAGSTRPSNSRLNLSSGQAGINALNLRNLGSERTLVLLDGRRSVGSTVTGLVDVNTIPQMLVKSVEVVTGGASSAYGSDAVAGVVNFVLDKKYKGLKVQIDNGVTDKGDGYNYSMAVAAGTSFGSGARGRVRSGRGRSRLERYRLRPHPRPELDHQQHDPALPDPPAGGRCQFHAGRPHHQFRRRNRIGNRRQQPARHLFRGERAAAAISVRGADLPVSDRQCGTVADAGRVVAGQRFGPAHRPCPRRRPLRTVRPA